MRCIVLAAVLFAAVGNAATPIAIHFPTSCPAGLFTYTMTFAAPAADGTARTWEFSSGPASFRHAGVTLTAGTSLACAAANVSSGIGPHGPWTETALTWVRPGTASPRFVTALRLDKAAAVFVQRYPDGAEGTSTADPDAVVSSFPSFTTTTSGTASERLGFVHFAGFMAGDYPQYGTWDSNASYPRGTFLLSGGIRNSGVLCLFSRDRRASLVISPLTQFMSASLLKYNDTVAWGVMGNASRIPKGFEASWAVVPAVGMGVNDAVFHWGSYMLSEYGKRATPHARDHTLQYLGYSTDNGAFYYYYTGEKAKNYQELMRMIKAYAIEARIPYQYIQLDSWWYYRQDGADKTGVPLSGVTNWTALPNVFPGGMPAVYNETQWPVMAHNRYWAPNNVYASNPQTPVGPTKYDGKKFPFVWGNEAGLPTTFEFWDYLFTINDNWGLAVYEQDWLSLTTKMVTELQCDVELGRTWLLQMARAATKHGLTVQYCMSFPRHVLTSLETDSVTQARASNDYQPQSQIFDLNQWRIGESSLWIGAIGIAASKDNYWSMPNSQYDPHYDPVWNSSERRNRLESVVSSMANGVVQVSDRIGYSNRSLIVRCCSADGRILRPDVAGAPIDKYFVDRAFGAPGTPFGGSLLNGGTIHATRSTIANWGTWTYVLSVNLHATVNFTTEDLPTVAQAEFASAAVVGWLAWETNKTSDVVVFGNGPLALAETNEYTFEYWTFAPIPAAIAQAEGWAVLGEQDKWISASTQRIVSVTLTVVNGRATTSVTVRGAAAETITMAFGNSRTGAVVRVSCQVPESLQVIFNVSPAGSGSCATL